MGKTIESLEKQRAVIKRVTIGEAKDRIRNGGCVGERLKYVKRVE